jgi:Ca2+-dependent lipid-binding protein
MNGSNSYNEEKLMVGVVVVHNLMPKDGKGSSSPFVEVEFENQRLRTQVRYSDLNPIWNEKLIFHVKDVADLPYRTVEISIFNERRLTNNRNFLGKVRVSGSSIAKEGEEVVQLYTLDKRSLFSYIRGEINLKLYLSVKEEVKASSGFSKKTKKLQGPSSTMVALAQHQLVQENKQTQQAQNHSKPFEPNIGFLRPAALACLAHHGDVVVGGAATLSLMLVG